MDEQLGRLSIIFSVRFLFFLLFVRLFLDLCTFSCSTCAAYNNGPAATLSIAPFLFLFLFFFLFFFLFLF
jgi:hypothetical protein